MMLDLLGAPKPLFCPDHQPRCDVLADPDDSHPGPVLWDTEMLCVQTHALYFVAVTGLSEGHSELGERSRFPVLVEIMVDANHVFDDDGLWPHAINEVEELPRQFVPLVVRIPPTGHREALARRPARHEVDVFRAQFVDEGVVGEEVGDLGDDEPCIGLLAEALLEVPRPLLGLFDALDQVVVEGLSGHRRLLDGEEQLEPRLLEAQREAAAAREEINV